MPVVSSLLPLFAKPLLYATLGMVSCRKSALSRKHRDMEPSAKRAGRNAGCAKETAPNGWLQGGHCHVVVDRNCSFDPLGSGHADHAGRGHIEPLFRGLCPFPGCIAGP